MRTFERQRQCGVRTQHVSRLEGGSRSPVFENSEEAGVTGAKKEEQAVILDVVEYKHGGDVMGALISISNMMTNCHVKLFSSSKLLKKYFVYMSDF